MKRVLVCCDGSEFSTHALEWALEKFIQEGDELILLSAFQVPMTTVVLAPELDLIMDDQSDALRDEIRQATQTSLEALAAQYLDPRKISYSITLEEGDARDIIAQCAEDKAVDAIVVGSHGKGAVKRLLLGSVSDAVVHSCKCAVLVVHKEDHPA